jgi:hypothetical protein
MRCHRCREVRGHDLGEADRQTLLKGYPDHSRVRKRSARAAVIDVNQTKKKVSAAPQGFGIVREPQPAFGKRDSGGDAQNASFAATRALNWSVPIAGS